MPEELTMESLQFSLAGWEVTYGTPSSITSAGDADIVAEDANTLTVKSEAMVDIQGWTTRLEQTFYPTNIALQRGFTYFWTAGSAGDALWDCTFIMPRPLSDSEQTELIALAYPSFRGDDAASSSAIDKQHVVWGSWAFVASNSTVAGYGVPMDGSTFGTGLPTLAKRLYIYRFVHVDKAGDATKIRVPPLNGILDGAFGKEPDLEYMERLRRTFVNASDLE